MKHLHKTATLLAALCAFAAAATTSLHAQDMKLPAPQKTGGMPLMEALAKRSSARSFSKSRELTQQQLSNLLWAAFGINRDDGKRTAPSASNRQEHDLYVLLKTGAYLYDAKTHTLVLIAAGDKRDASTPAKSQPFANDASVTVLMVADATRRNSNKTIDTLSSNDREMIAANAGYISQNMYLFCASEGLATVVRATINREKVTATLSLKPTQWIVLAQSIGYAPR
jgi:SagB-type dehydrogenase family enzyme